MRVCAYYRVSSAQQRDRDTIAGQRAEVRRLVESRGYELVAEHEDDGRSARTKLAARTGFASVLELARRRKIDAVVCVAFDRLTRAEDLAEQGAILGTLQAAGVRLVTGGGEETDLGTFSGRLTALLRGQLAAEESAEKSRRAKRGRARAVREGRSPGRVPYGYAFAGTWSAPGAVEILGIYQRAADGEALAVIAGDLNRRSVASDTGRPWSGSMVREVVRCRRRNGDPYVTGLWKAHASEPAIEVPAMVPAELAAAARAAISGRFRSPAPVAKHVHFLDAGACRCSLCGGTIIIVSCRGRRRKDGSRDRFAYYACTNRYEGRARGWACTMPNQAVAKVDAAVWRAVLAWVDGGAAKVAAAELASGKEQVGEDLAAAERQLEAEGARLAALAEALGGGAISAESYRQQVARVKARRDFAAQQVATWTEAAKGDAQVDARARAEVRMAVRAAVDPAARRELVRELWPRWAMDPSGVAPILAGEAVGEATAVRHKIGRVAL